MNTHSRGFNPIGIIIIVALIIAAAAAEYYGAFSVPSKLNQAPSDASTTSSSAATTTQPQVPSGWKTHASPVGVTFAYPAEYEQPFENPYTTEKNIQVRVATENQQKWIDIDKESSEGMGCHYGYCDAPATETLKVGSFMWDKVGVPRGVEVDDAKVYVGWRTTVGQCRFYVTFVNEPRQKEFLTSLQIDPNICP